MSKTSYINGLPLILLAFALSLAGAGCINLGKDAPQKTYRMIEVSRPEIEVSPTGGETVLQITRFSISSSFAGKEFVYKTGTNGFQTDYYNAFFMSPADMISGQTRTWIEKAQLFKYVVDSGSHLDNTHILEGAVNAIYGDYSDPADPRAVMEMQFLLINDNVVPPMGILEKQYKVTVRVADESPEALVQGWNKGLSEILTQFESAVRQMELK